MKQTFFAVVVVFLTMCGKANATGIIAGATEFTQIANNIQLALSYVEQAQQTITQFNQYKTMLQNLQQLSPGQLTGQVVRDLWADQNMNEAFSNLRKIYINGQQMAYTASSMEGRFKQAHPGYGQSNGATDFFKAYQGWSDNSLYQLKNATKAVTAQIDKFDTEAGMMDELQNASNSADGQLKAVQAGNQIGVAMVGQMQKLRQLQMAQMQAQNAYTAGQQSRQDASDAQLQQFLKNAKDFKTDEYGKGKVLFK